MLSLIIHPGSFPLKVELSSGDLDKRKIYIERQQTLGRAMEFFFRTSTTTTNVLIVWEYFMSLKYYSDTAAAAAAAAAVVGGQTSECTISIKNSAAAAILFRYVTADFSDTRHEINFHHPSTLNKWMKRVNEWVSEWVKEQQQQQQLWWHQ
jgi:hypothetical protein